MFDLIILFFLTKLDICNTNRDDLNKKKWRKTS